MIAAVALAASFTTPAFACVEVMTPKSAKKAFQQANIVVRVRALSEDYVPVPETRSLRVGVGAGEILEVLKGRARIGDVINYRVVDGEGSSVDCPARRTTRPGRSYKLYLKSVGDWGPPIILLPTD